MKELHDFGRTISKAIKRAAEGGETLTVVAADHKTGGLTLYDGDLATGRIEVRLASTSHTDVTAPVCVFDPGAGEFIGFTDNTGIFWKIKKSMRL